MKAIVVLGHRLMDDGHPTIELSKRLDLGIKLFNKFDANAIIFSGGRANPLTEITEAEVMREYAILKGIAPSKMILEEKSLDTIGNAIFTKELIKGRFDELYVATSCYHIRRTSFIFKMVFGESYKLNFDYCADTKGKGEFEDIKLNQAKVFFTGMHSEDDAKLRRRLLECDLYKDRIIMKGK